MTALTCALAVLAVWLMTAAPAGPARLPGRASMALLLCAVGSLVATGLRPRSVAAAVVLSGAGWSVVALWRRVRRRRSVALISDCVLSACELLAAELAAGRAPPAALDRAAEDWSPLRPVAETAAFGGDVAGALVDLGRTPGAGGLRLVGAAWAVTHHSGRGLADALGHVADAIRADQRTARVIAGELASARATARLVAVLPAAALLMAAGGGGDPLGFLLGDPAGLACLAGGLALGLGGVWWIESIADSVAT